jgi:PKHD-type hydroxylase
MIEENYYWYWDSFLSKETCEQITEEYYKPEKSVTGSYRISPNTYGTGELRETNVCWVDSNSQLGLLMFNYILIANLKTKWYFDIEKIQSVQVGEYSIGGHYDWHEDESICSRNNFNNQRKISISVLLSESDSYDGGDLLFKGQNEPITRNQGSIIVFPSFIEHKVTPVTRGVRYTAVTWAVGPYFK